MTCVNAPRAFPADAGRMNARILESAGAVAGPHASAWVRRVAQVGFWFFLVKGLLWLAIPAAALIAGQYFDGF